MSQYKTEINELKTDPAHWDYARGKIAQLKLMLKNKKAEIAAQQRIEQQASNAQPENNELRRRALALAAQNRMVTV
jgi:hypothetical protein